MITTIVFVLWLTAATSKGYQWGPEADARSLKQLGRKLRRLRLTR